jgi:hypothetical protein
LLFNRWHTQGLQFWTKYWQTQGLQFWNAQTNRLRIGMVNLEVWLLFLLSVGLVSLLPLNVRMLRPEPTNTLQAIDKFIVKLAFQLFTILLHHIIHTVIDLTHLFH